MMDRAAYTTIELRLRMRVTPLRRRAQDELRAHLLTPHQ